MTDSFISTGRYILPVSLFDFEHSHIAARLPEDVQELQALYLTSQACVLLLMLKTHLKDAYGFTDK